MSAFEMTATTANDEVALLYEFFKCAVV